MSNPKSVRIEHPIAQTVGTLLLAWLAALFCVAIGTPLPWMIGPLVSVAVATHAGWTTHSATPLRNTGQWVIGTALGAYFTPSVLAVLVDLGWVIGLSVVWSLLLGWLFGRWLLRQPEAIPAGALGEVPAGASDPSPAWRATAYFSGAIGAASEMTLLAERAGARTDLVAASHSLRLLIVTLSLPFALQFAGVRGLDVWVAAPQPVDAVGLLLLGLAAAAGVFLMHRLDQANPWFLGALIASAGLAMAGVPTSSVPAWLSNAAQLVIGVSLAVRFRPGFIAVAPRWMAAVATGTLVLLLVSALAAWALARVIQLPVPTMVLALSPGGITEMAITAKVLQLGVPLVTAFQVSRLLAVLLLVEPLYKRGWGGSSQSPTKH